jgi:hypothetical protein
MIQRLSVGLKALKKQMDLVDAMASQHIEDAEIGLWDGLANFLSALKESLEDVPEGGAVEVFRGKDN